MRVHEGEFKNARFYVYRNNLFFVSFYGEVNVKYMLTRTEINMIVERFADITGQQNDVVMNIKQCAKYLGISPDALRKRVYDGTLPYSKKGRLLYFSRLEINQYY